MATIETEYRLDETVRATIGAGGTATVTNVGPDQNGERWEIENDSVSGSATATLSVYRGNDQGRLLDFTKHAEGDSSDTKIPVKSGEVISFVWTGGTPGASMLAHIEGTRYVRGQRAY